MRELDAYSCSLDGSALVEAAAGTGKTYNIQILYVRFILEKKFPVDSIVVVTFTNAATAELKQRIRTILDDCLALARRQPEPESWSWQEADDERCRRLLENSGCTPRECQKLLVNALMLFDQAVISTIDGFCQRLLSEFAFENGVRYARTIEGNYKQILRELTRDFYRRLLYNRQLNPDGKLGELLKFAAADEKTIASFAEYAHGHPDLQFRISEPDYNAGELPLPEEYYSAECTPELLEPLKQPPQLHAKLLAALNQLAAMLTAQGTSLKEEFKPVALLNALFKPSNTLEDYYQNGISIAENLNKKGVAEKLEKNFARSSPEIRQCYQSIRDLLGPLYDEPERIRNAARRLHITVLMSARREILAQFEARKKRDGFTTFTDNLYEVRSAVLNNHDWRALLKQRFKTAIIDEFQDTNPAQCDIFRAIFLDDQHSFFMVGDPRQAIYAFRGGDIEAYLKARGQAAEQYSLVRNYRSGQPLLNSICALFQNDGFMHQEISINEISAGEDNRARGMVHQGQLLEHPLAAVASGNAKGSRFDPCVLKILELLGNPEANQLVMKDGSRRAITPGDIAVLVCDKLTARRLLKQLTRVGVPAVFTCSENILLSEEAQELEQLLSAIMKPHKQNLLTTALVSHFCAVPPQELAEFQQHPEKIAEHQTSFMELQAAWKEKSFMAMFNLLLEKYRAHEKCSGDMAIERRLTNWFQLADLLQEMTQKKHLTPNGLWQKFTRLRNEALNTANDNPPEEYEQQLASQQESVTLMTIHISKGLQFPIVMLPDLNGTTVALTSQAGSGKKSPQSYHNSEGQLCYNIDWIVNNDTVERCLEEGLQEKLRLFYVAVTRAENGCFFFSTHGYKNTDRVGAKNEQAGWPLGWLLNERGGTDLEGKPNRLEGAAKIVDFGSLTQTAPALTVCALPENLPVFQPSATQKAIAPLIDLSGLRLSEAGYVNSFSALSGNIHQSVRTPDFLEGDQSRKDDDDAGEAESAPESNAGEPVFAIPRGAEIGTFLHKVIEVLDFRIAPEDPRLPEFLRRALEIEGLSSRIPAGSPADTGLILLFQNLLSAKFDLHDQYLSFRLADIAPAARLPELSFCSYQQQPFELTKLIQALKENREGRLPELLNGRRLSADSFLNGQIDLLAQIDGKFYIFDWKSNVIDSKFSSFAPESNGMRFNDGEPYCGLAAEMASNAYQLQYLIYLGATLKYLAMRLDIKTWTPELYQKYFGGVYYVFLRGLDKNSNRGLFFDRPGWNIAELMIQKRPA